MSAVAGDGFRGAHVRELLVPEPIGLEVRQAPVRIAEVRPAGRRPMVRVDRRLTPAECLLGMRDRQMQIRIRRAAAQQFLVESDGAIMFAKADGTRGIQRLQHPVLGVLAEELLELAARFAVLVFLDKHGGVFLAGNTVIGRQFEHGREQQFRIVEHLARDADAGEQAHGFDLIAMLQQIGAYQRLGCVQIAILEQ